MRVLFWNVNDKENSLLLAGCVAEHKIDIVVLAEHKNVDIGHFLELQPNYKVIRSMGACDKIQVLSSYQYLVTLKHEQHRYALFKIEHESEKYLMAGIHLPDRFTSDTSIRQAEIREIVRDICNLEEREKCCETFVIGDYNANPYDDEMVGILGFDAVLFKNVIEKQETHTVDGRRYKRFYNPVLDYISEDKKQYGSFYYTGGSKDIVWHCLDQIIVRKSLIDSIRSMKYLKKINKTDLISNTSPKKAISDHLPLLVEIGG